MGSTKSFFFLDEKTFIVSHLLNKQNDRITSFCQDVSEVRNVSTIILQRCLQCGSPRDTSLLCVSTKISSRQKCFLGSIGLSKRAIISFNKMRHNPTPPKLFRTSCRKTSIFDRMIFASYNHHI